MRYNRSVISSCRIYAISRYRMWQMTLPPVLVPARPTAAELAWTVLMYSPIFR